MGRFLQKEFPSDDPAARDLVALGWEPAPPVFLPIHPGEIHVWRLELQLDPAHPPGEQRRAQTRWILRGLIAGYLNCDPNQLAFASGPHGKPFLEGHDLEFNYSHTDTLALIALTRGGAIGIDLESTQRQVDAEGIAARVFTQAEQQSGDFFRVWTRKEAIVKAHGGGIASGLTRFSVAEIEEGSAQWPRLIHLDGETYEVTDLPLGTGFIAALAWKGMAAMEVRRFFIPRTR